MGDPLSTVAAVVGLADVVFRASSKLYNFFSELRNVPQDIQDLTQSLRIWKSISQSLRDLSIRYQNSLFASEDGLTFNDITDTLASCQGACNDIDTLINRQGKTSRLLARSTRAKNIKWLFDTETVQAALNKLDRSKQSLIVALAAIGR